MSILYIRQLAYGAPYRIIYATQCKLPCLAYRCGKRLGLKGLNPFRPYYMEFTMNAEEAEFYEIVREEAQKEFDPLELVYPNEVPVFEKYDEYVPDELIRKGFAYGVLDIEGMKKRVLSWNGVHQETVTAE